MIEWGKCLRHGIVFERCCRLFERDAPRAHPFLRPAVDAVRENVRDGLSRSIGRGIGRDGDTVVEAVKWDDGTLSVRVVDDVGGGHGGGKLESGEHEPSVSDA